MAKKPVNKKEQAAARKVDASKNVRSRKAKGASSASGTSSSRSRARRRGQSSSVSVAEVPLQPTSIDIWDKKYRLKDNHGNPVDKDIKATYKRVARALASLEKASVRKHWEKEFLWALNNGAIPAGRIMSNAGAEKYKPGTSTINCTVSGTIEDSMDGILAMVHEAGLTLKGGSGIGYEFSTLRPKGAYVAGPGANTSGPLSFMDIFDSMCFTVSSAGGRRGAQMGTFDVSHPDIMDFIRAKREDGRLRQFNLSCLVTKEFMQAVKEDGDWDLVFPASAHDLELAESGECVIVYRRVANPPSTAVFNEDGLVACRVYRTIKARRLWDVIMASTYDYAEPGFILIDEVNRMNNNWFCEEIRATNPCVVGSTQVLTDQGRFSVAELVEIVQKGCQYKPRILGIAGAESGSRQLGYFHLSDAFLTKRDAETVVITIDNGVSLVCTPDHPIFAPDRNCYQDASEFVVGDRLLYASNNDLKCHEIVSIQQGQQEDVYDLVVAHAHNFFADGILVHNCGEQPLPPYGACLLGSVNLTRFVQNPFTSEATFDWEKFERVVGIFTRMLDNVVEINGLPLEQQRHEIMTKRRHGMGFLGLGSTLTMLGIPYGSPESVRFTEEVSYRLARRGYEEGIELAKEKGEAPCLQQEYELTQRHFLLRPELKEDGYKVGDKVRGRELWCKYSHYLRQFRDSDRPGARELYESLLKHGCRFTHHSSIAPTGTISLSLANNASNGIEPSFAHHYKRNVIREGKKTKDQVDVFSYELLAYRQYVDPDAMPFSEDPAHKLPSYFVTADDILPQQHVDIQAAAQRWIDSSISKTINVPTNFPYEDFKDIYMYAYDKGLKGCTTFRFNPDAFSGVLVKENDLANTTYKFRLENGEVIEARGNDKIEYDGEIHTAANLYDALKEGYYGKF
ncbi:MAG: hypothetical protein CUN56_00615 [Phototrophicales bacterium]|nr:MAG: hypothetical protein CUN56_00615 [Phototrophicales bacterium]